jgi:hypothetical protein
MDGKEIIEEGGGLNVVLRVCKFISSLERGESKAKYNNLFVKNFPGDLS